jgi:hypothetical protein
MTHSEADNRTFNFTMQFNNPYMYGLLNKRSDYLNFKCLDCSPIIANKSGELVG